MNIKLLTEHHLEFLSFKGIAQACLSLFMSKCHIVGNHMSRLICICIIINVQIFSYVWLKRLGRDGCQRAAIVLSGE